VPGCRLKQEFTARMSLARGSAIHRADTRAASRRWIAARFKRAIPLSRNRPSFARARRCLFTRRHAGLLFLAPGVQDAVLSLARRLQVTFPNIMAARSVRARARAHPLARFRWNASARSASSGSETRTRELQIEWETARLCAQVS
jgi:hypothetical protein